MATFTRADDLRGAEFLDAWGMLERTWAATLERVVAMPATILEEEWEHHRYAVRDLDAIAAKSDA